MTSSISTDSDERAIANQRNLRRLVLSVQASLHKLNLLIAICDNPFYRDELIRTYEAELTAKGITCYQIHLDRQQPSLKQSLIDWQTHTPDWNSDKPSLVTVLGGDQLLGVRLQQPKSEQERFFFSVQWTREGLRDFQSPIVLWVTEAVAKGLAQQAPDFWSWRGGVFEFDQPLSWPVSNQPQALEHQRESDDEPLADPAELEQQIAALQAEDANSPLLDSLYQSLGETYYERLKRGISIDRPQETAKAIAAFQSAIALRQSLPAPTPLATSLNHLALLYESQGRYGEAEPLLLQALNIHRSQLGPDHPNTATSLNNLAALYRSQGRYSEAEPLYLQALNIHRSQLGPDHPSTASSLNGLAVLYESQGRYGEAEPLLLQALNIHRSQLGPDHPNTATSLNNLAALYRSQGRYGEAEPLYLQALDIIRSQLGQAHPSTATSLNNLAGLYSSQGRYSEAEPLYLQALSIWFNQLGEKHPNTQTVQGNFRYFLQQVVEAGRTAELSDHPITQGTLAQLQE